MPPFPERESSILAKLKRKKGPGAGSALDDGRRDPSSNDINGGVEPTPSTVVSPLGLGYQAGSSKGGTSSHFHLYFLQSTPSPSADLLGLRAAPPPAAPAAPSGAGNLLVDVFSDGPAPQPSLGPTPEEAFLRYHTPWDLFLCPSQLALPCPCASVHPGCHLSRPPPSLWPLWTVNCPWPPFVVLSHHRVSACFSFSPLLPLSLSSALLLPVWDWLPATPVFSVCSGIGWPSELEPPAPESPMALLADPAPAAE